MIENTELIGQCANLIQQEIQKRLDQKMAYNQIGKEVSNLLKPWGLKIKPKTLAKRAERMANAKNVTKPELKPKTTLEKIQALYNKLTNVEIDQFFDWINILVILGDKDDRQDTDFSALGYNLPITSNKIRNEKADHFLMT